MIEDNKIDKSKWKVRHVIVAAALSVLLTAALVILGAILFPKEDIFFDIGIIVVDCIVIYYFSSKYPLNLFAGINIRKLFKYCSIGAILILIIYTYNNYSGSFNFTKEFNYFSDLSITGKYWYLFFLVIVAPFFEEILFRGFFYRILKNRYNIFWGFLISATLFSAVHLFRTDIILQSCLYTYIYEKTETIWGSIITHSINNLLWAIFVLLIA